MANDVQQLTLSGDLIDLTMGNARWRRLTEERARQREIGVFTSTSRARWRGKPGRDVRIVEQTEPGLNPAGKRRAAIPHGRSLRSSCLGYTKQYGKDLKPAPPIPPAARR